MEQPKKPLTHLLVLQDNFINLAQFSEVSLSLSRSLGTVCLYPKSCSTHRLAWSTHANFSSSASSAATMAMLTMLQRIWPGSGLDLVQLRSGTAAAAASSMPKGGRFSISLPCAIHQYHFINFHRCPTRTCLPPPLAPQLNSTQLYITLQFVVYLLKDMQISQPPRSHRPPPFSRLFSALSFFICNDTKVFFFYSD